MEGMVSRTDADTMTAPVLSVTRPFKDVVACPMAAMLQATKSAARQSACSTRERITDGSRKCGILGSRAVLGIRSEVRCAEPTGDPLNAAFAPASDWARV